VQDRQRPVLEPALDVLDGTPAAPEAELAGDRPVAQLGQGHGLGVEARGLQTQLQRMASEPEESFDHAAAQVRALKCQTWLGSPELRIPRRPPRTCSSG
jgi:hypothetical protein